jgi:pilus assembly protein CpaC
MKGFLAISALLFLLHDNPAVAQLIYRIEIHKDKMGKLSTLLGIVLAFFFTSGVVGAVEPGDTISVTLYKSHILRLSQSAKRVSVGNPGVADIVVLRSKQVHIVGKNLGSTNVVFWDHAEEIFASYNIEVTHDLMSLKRKLHELMPEEDIQVHSAQERIVLSGSVSNAVRMSAAEELAFSFLPECITSESNVTIRDASGGNPQVTQQGGGNNSKASGECKEGSIINLMEVGGAQQVMLQVTIAEVARTVLKSLNANLNFISLSGEGNTVLGAVSGGASFPNVLVDGDQLVPIFGGVAPVTQSPIGPPLQWIDTDPSIADTGFFLGHLTGSSFFSAMLDISRQSGLAKILAEPTLTTMTGRKARFLAGGEFPIPVPGGDGEVTIEFKDFGVGVEFLPLVLDSGKINLKLDIGVSELSSDHAVAVGVTGSQSTFIIPSLNKRSVSSTVELGNGQTIGIAGLIKDNMRELVDKLPGLGSVPVLGALFRSQEFLSGQTELVIFVTPHLARPIDSEKIRLPTDAFVPPSDWEFYFLGATESLEQDEEAPSATQVTATIFMNDPDGVQFGHDF